MVCFFKHSLFAYSWSLVIFFWDVPSFLLRFSFGDIIRYVAYQFTFTFLESILVTFSIALLGLILPAKYLRKNFRASGSALALAFAINAIVFKERSNITVWMANTFFIQTFSAVQITLKIWAVSLVVLPIGLIMATKFNKIERVVNNFVERLSVLVSIYVVLSLLGILLVVIRNIN